MTASATGRAGVVPVEVEGLWEAYRRRSRNGWRSRGESRWALRDVGLSVAAGEALGVVGANGSGKTTLLQVLAGVLRPTRGRVNVTGRTASLVDLAAGFHRDLTGEENLMIGGVLLGLSRREVREAHDEIAAFSGLPADALDQPLATYSAGMGLRLGFSLVVHTRPDVLLVDEVLAVGDDAFQRRCVDRVGALQAAGCAVVLVSHDLDLVRRRCDRVAVLDAGHLELIAPPEVALSHYASLASSVATGDAAEVPEARLFEGSWRAQAARRRRGV